METPSTTKDEKNTKARRNLKRFARVWPHQSKDGLDYWSGTADRGPFERPARIVMFQNTTNKNPTNPQFDIYVDLESTDPAQSAEAAQDHAQEATQGSDKETPF